MKRFWRTFLIACLLIASLWANASAMTMWDYYWGKDGYAVKLTQADLDDIEQMWEKIDTLSLGSGIRETAEMYTLEDEYNDYLKLTEPVMERYYDDVGAYRWVPGLPDEAFRHDGQLTKREIRAVTLAQLSPFPNALLWDVGAGCGSIAIEWMRAGMGTRAIAVEGRADRVAMIRANADALGVPDLEIVEAVAPEGLEGLDPPDVVFIGGGINNEGLFEACWDALAPGGQLVANAVTIEGEARLADLRGAFGGELIRLSVARAARVGRYCGWKSLMPVTIWSVVKGGGE